MEKEAVSFESEFGAGEGPKLKAPVGDNDVQQFNEFASEWVKSHNIPEPAKRKDYESQAEAADDFLGKTKESPQPKTQEQVVENPNQVVDQETGRKFDSELDYLKWKIGSDGQQKGEEIKQLREELARLTGEKQQEQPHSPTPKEIKAQLFPSLAEDQLDDPAVNVMYEGMQRLAQDFYSEITKIKESMASEDRSLKETLELMHKRQALGIDESREESLLQNNPGLANAVSGLPAAQRVAILAEVDRLRRDSESKVKVNPTLNPRDVVEASSGVMVGPEDGEDFAKKFSKLDAKQMGSVLQGLALQGIVPEGIKSRMRS